ncbi:hypothetical protein, partial [Comamonas kerstersii]|uniref:hypothetical protein n=1 Tax=Comamonas kerstersii TaxID=225992 RepID=UPI000ADA0899
ELIKKQELQAQSLQALEADLVASHKAKDAETQAKKNLQAQLEALKAEQQDTRQRQALLDEELYRAEVQLKLLEELLLPDAQQKPVASDAAHTPSTGSAAAHNAE